MRMHYDEKVDALYLSLDESDVVDSEEVKPGIILDFNAAGEVVGIEVLDVKQAAPAKALGITQPRFNALLKGKIGLFSLDALVNIATRAGLNVRLVVKKAA